jgi:hypothetical protein
MKKPDHMQVSNASFLARMQTRSCIQLQ